MVIARSSYRGTADRVALRYLVRLADSIPAKWFKERAAELRAVLKTPLDSGLQFWSGKVEAALTGFFDVFERDFARLAPAHTDALEPLLREARRNLRLSLIPLWDLENFRQRHIFDPDIRGIEDRLRHAGAWACVDRIESSVKTIGDLYKTTFSVPSDALERLIGKILAKPGNSRDAVAAIRAAAPKIVTKTKPPWSPAGWVDDAFDALTKAWTPERFTTFDVKGLRVVFEYSPPPAEIDQYMRHVLEAYRALSQKTLSKAWYGTLFICRGCDSSAGGRYEIGPDTVRLYAAPGSHATYAIVHELGHRYWFKSMSQRQRGRFADLVKVHTVAQPRNAPPLLQVKRFTNRDIADGHRAVDRFDARFRPLLGKLESGANPDALAGVMRSALAGLKKDLRAFTSLVADSKVLSGRAIDVHNDYAVPLARARHAVEEAITKGDWAAIDAGAVGSIVTAAHAWVDAAARAFNAIADEQLAGLEGGQEWLDSYLQNEAPVVPVSAYGKTNIDEAFAEVFAHYVLEFDITRDQLESFRTVFARARSEGSLAPCRPEPSSLVGDN